MQTTRTILRDNSPYSLGKFIGLDYGSLDPYDSLLLQLLPELPVWKTYKVKSLERRPELISFQIYGTTDLYALFMFYNGIIDHQELVTGTILNVFKRRDLDDLIGQITTVQVQSVRGEVRLTGQDMTSLAERYFK